MLIPILDPDHEGHLEYVEQMLNTDSRNGGPEQFACRQKECYYQAWSEGALNVHTQLAHRVGPHRAQGSNVSTAKVQKYCTVPGCSFNTFDELQLRNHRRNKHKIESTTTSKTSIYSGYSPRETRQEQVAPTTRARAVEYWGERYMPEREKK